MQTKGFFGGRQECLAPALLVMAGLVLPGCPSSEPRAGLTGAELQASLDHYLSDRRVAVGSEAVAEQPPWEAMGRRKLPVTPFEGRVPALQRLQDLAGHGPEIRPLLAALRRGEAARVLPEALRLLSADPGNDLARYVYAKAAQDLGHAQAALREFDHLIQRAPGLARAYLQKGVLLSDLFRHDQALLVLDQAIAVGPTWEAHRQRGITLCFARRFDESEWDLWKSVEGKPGDGNAYYDLAWMYAQRKDVPNTIEMLRFSARDPDFFKVRMSRAAILEDVFFRPIEDDPALRAYAARLPDRSLVPEPVYPVLFRSTGVHLDDER